MFSRILPVFSNLETVQKKNKYSLSALTTIETIIDSLQRHARTNNYNINERGNNTRLCQIRDNLYHLFYIDVLHLAYVTAIL